MMFSASLPDRLEVADAFYHSYARYAAKSESLPKIASSLIFEGDVSRLPRHKREAIASTQLTDYLINMVGFALNQLRQGSLVTLTPGSLRYGAPLRRLAYRQAIERVKETVVRTYFTPEVNELGIVITLPTEFTEDILRALREANYQPHRADLSNTWVARII